MGAPLRLAAFSVADRATLAACHQLFAARFRAPQGPPYVPGPGEHGRVSLPGQLLLRLLSRRPKSTALFASRRGLRRLSAELECAPGCLSPSSHALCRSENVFSGASDEARPDEHGLLHREPRPFSRPSVCRVRHAHSGPLENPRRLSKIYS